MAFRDTDRNLMDRTGELRLGNMSGGNCVREIRLGYVVQILPICHDWRSKLPGITIEKSGDFFNRIYPGLLCSGRAGGFDLGEFVKIP